MEWWFIKNDFKGSILDLEGNGMIEEDFGGYCGLDMSV